MISMQPRAILVVIDKAWKKDVFSGPRGVTPLGTCTSIGARAPALAGAATLLLKIFSLTSAKSPLQKTKPTFCLMWGRSLRCRKERKVTHKICQVQYICNGTCKRLPVLAFYKDCPVPLDIVVITSTHIRVYSRLPYPRKRTV